MRERTPTPSLGGLALNGAKLIASPASAGLCVLFAIAAGFLNLLNHFQTHVRKTLGVSNAIPNPIIASWADSANKATGFFFKHISQPIISEATKGLAVVTRSLARAGYGSSDDAEYPERVETPPAEYGEQQVALDEIVMEEAIGHNPGPNRNPSITPHPLFCRPLSACGIQAGVHVPPHVGGGHIIV